MLSIGAIHAAPTAYTARGGDVVDMLASTGLPILLFVGAALHDALIVVTTLVVWLG